MKIERPFLILAAAAFVLAGCEGFQGGDYSKTDGIHPLPLLIIGTALVAAARD